MKQISENFHPTYNNLIIITIYVSIYGCYIKKINNCFSLLVIKHEKQKWHTLEKKLYLKFMLNFRLMNELYLLKNLHYIENFISMIYIFNLVIYAYCYWHYKKTLTMLFKIFVLHILK